MDIRIRLRPWLESRLNDGWIEGLKWIDKEKGVFKIPWKHHSKHTWTEEDAAIFKDWAVVTGRFREGVDKPDWPMWKTRLRCALNKAPDIQEVKQRHNLHCEEPFKVYRFVSKTESMWRANATRNASMIFDGIPAASRLGPVNVTPIASSRRETCASLTTQRRPALYIQCVSGSETSTKPIALIRRNDGLYVKQWPIPPYQSIYSNNLNHSQMNQLDNISNRDLMGYDPSSYDYDENNNLSPTRYINNQTYINTPNVFRRVSTSPISLCGRYLPGLSTFSSQTSQILPDIMEPEYHQLGVRIQHLNIRVKDAIITNPNGCCIYFGRFDEISSLAAPDPVEAQIPHHVSEANKAYVDLLLDNMLRGIILSVSQGSIFAERMCKCAVFVYIPTSDGSYFLLKKLGRRVREKIFDYDQFLTELQFYRQSRHSRPHFEVILAFGQQLRAGISTESLLVWSRVASCRAWFQLHKNRSLPSSDISFSSDLLPLDSVSRFANLEHTTNEVIMEQSDCLTHSGTNVSNDCNGYHSMIKVEDIDSVNDHDVAAVSLVDSLDPEGIVTEQIIEEGVEVPLDDGDDLTYDAAGSVMHENIIVCDASHVVTCVSNTVATHDVFLNHSDRIDSKSHLIPNIETTVPCRFSNNSNA